MDCRCETQSGRVLGRILAYQAEQQRLWDEQRVVASEIEAAVAERSAYRTAYEVSDFGRKEDLHELIIKVTGVLQGLFRRDMLISNRLTLVGSAICVLLDAQIDAGRLAVYLRFVAGHAAALRRRAAEVLGRDDDDDLPALSVALMGCADEVFLRVFAIPEVCDEVSDEFFDRFWPQALRGTGSAPFRRMLTAAWWRFEGEQAWVPA